MSRLRKMRVVFLCSGGGGNLRFVYKAIDSAWINGIEIAAVLTDRMCQANHFATSVGLSNMCIDFGQDNQASFLAELVRLEPDLVVTTVHKILRKEVVDTFRGRLINLHYSLLPAFGGLIGMRTVKASIDYGSKLVGATTHFVDESVDGGKPIVQCAIPLHADETLSNALSDLVFRCGCLTLLASIDLIVNGRTANSGAVEISGRTCLFAGSAVSHFSAIGDESFWREVSQGV